MPSLVELLDAHDSLARELAAFLSRTDLRSLLAVSRACVHSCVRRDLFARSRWRLPPMQWLAERVLRDFTMRSAVSRVTVMCGWQQYLLRELPALKDVEVVTLQSKSTDADYETLAPQHYPVEQITTLDLSESNMNDMANLAAFTNLEKLVLPSEGNSWNMHVLESFGSLRSITCYPEVDLSFVEKLSNLRELDINDTHDGILSPVSKLEKLESLNVASSTIYDLESLMAVAPTLKSLDASEALVSSWSTQRADKAAFLASLTNVQELRLNISQFLDVGLEPFAPLVQLKVLEIGGVKFANLSPLSSLTQLEALEVMAPDADWSPIARMTKLKNLNQFAFTKIVNSDSETARILAALPSLETLSNPLVLSRAAPLPRLRSLELGAPLRDQGVHVDVGDPIDACCPNIEKLTLRGCIALSRLGLPRLKKLRSLSAMALDSATAHGRRRKPRIDYSAVVDVPRLTVLAMSCRCEARSYTFLSTLTDLQNLSMFNESITDLSPLSKLSQLEYLQIARAPVTDVTPLGDLRQLTQLRLTGTKAVDVSCLRGLPKLAVLELPGCADCSPLVDDYGSVLPSITLLRHGMNLHDWEAGRHYV